MNNGGDRIGEVHAKKKKDDKGCPKLRLLSHFAHIKDKM